MNMILTIAWRNIWRQPGRSSVLLAAIISGLWAGVVVVGYANGLILQRVDYLLETELSHGQIHHPEFQTEREPSMFIEDYDELAITLENHELISAFSPRTMVDGMLQSPVSTSGVTIRGIHPDMEANVSTIKQNIIEGDYLDVDVRHPILIGSHLATKHNLEIGNRVVLNFQDTENELVSASFNIVGIFQMSASAFNERNVFVISKNLSELISDELIYHEIAMWLHDFEQSQAVIDELKEAFPSLLHQTWKDLSPEVRYMSEAGGVMTAIIMTIIMLALAFGILNTMLMAIFERMRELGMLLAIGMSKQRVFMMILLESVILTLTGAIGGLFLAFATITWLGKSGIDLTSFGDGLAEWGFDSIIFPVMSTADYTQVVIVVVVAALLASLYPAVKAMRQNPLEVEKE